MNALTRDPMSVESLLRAVQSPERGGPCVFLGTVRNDAEVTGIEYSAYDEMAVAEITRMLDEARERWPEARVALQHRLRLIPLGEASISIPAAPGHPARAISPGPRVVREGE